MQIRVTLIVACLALSGAAAWGQADPSTKQADPAAKAQDNVPPNDKSDYSTGRTVSPEEKGQQQPQGQTGPLTTGSGGAPAASPQGQSPPGMQEAPEGSSKTIVEPK